MEVVNWFSIAGSCKQYFINLPGYSATSLHTMLRYSGSVSVWRRPNSVRTHALSSTYTLVSPQECLIVSHIQCVLYLELHGDLTQTSTIANIPFSGKLLREKDICKF